MKKIYSLLMALFMVLGATAGNVVVNPVKKDVPAKVNPMSKKLEAIAKKMQNAPVVTLNGVRENKALSVMKVEKQKLVSDAKRVAKQSAAAETVVIVADQWSYKYYDETGDWWMGISDATMTYVVHLDYYSDEFAGTFNEDDLDMNYSYIEYNGAGEQIFIEIEEATVVVTDDESGKSVDVTILGSDGKVYVTEAYEAPLPEAKGEKTLAYTTAELLDRCASDGWWQFAAEENGWYTSIVMEAMMLEGEYTRMDMVDPSYNYIAYSNGTDTTILDFLDINAKVTCEGRTYNLEADVLGTDTIMYHVTMSYTKPDPTDTVSIVATDLTIKEVDFYGVMVITTISASNDEYSVMISALKALPAGQYVTSDFLISASVITDKKEGNEITLTEANLTIAGEGNARTIVGEVVGENNVLYQLNLSYVTPELTDTVKVEFDHPGAIVWYDADSDYYMVNSNNNCIVYLDIVTEKDKLVGEYTTEDLLMDYTGVVEIVDGDSVIVELFDAKVVVTAKEENLYHVEAELSGKNGTLYLISSDAEVVKVGLQYDEQEGAVNEVYTADDEIYYTLDFIPDYGELYVDIVAADGSTLTTLTFMVDATDPDINVPAGVYVISDTNEKGTVLSGWYDSEYGAVGSYYATGALNRQGGFDVEKVWFMVSGTVTVAKNEDKSIAITVDAVNSYDVPVKVVYNVVSTSIENTEVVNGNTRKVIEDSQLYIIKDGVKYNVLGSEL